MGMKNAIATILIFLAAAAAAATPSPSEQERLRGLFFSLVIANECEAVLGDPSLLAAARKRLATELEKFDRAAATDMDRKISAYFDTPSVKRRSPTGLANETSCKKLQADIDAARD